MTQYFYGVYLAEHRVRFAFDLIRFILEPDALRASHITLRGPLSRRLSDSEISTIEGARSGGYVRLIEPGEFFEGPQNTVFVAAELGALRGWWHKPDYPSGQPHLTLYDGRDRRVAVSFLRLLEEYAWGLSVEVTGLRVIDKKLDTLFALRDLPFAIVDSEAARFGFSLGVPASRFVSLSLDNRFDLIRRILFQLRLPSVKSNGNGRPRGRSAGSGAVAKRG